MSGFTQQRVCLEVKSGGKGAGRPDFWMLSQPSWCEIFEEVCGKLEILVCLFAC